MGESDAPIEATITPPTEVNQHVDALRRSAVDTIGDLATKYEATNPALSQALQIAGRKCKEGATRIGAKALMVFGAMGVGTIGFHEGLRIGNQLAESLPDNYPAVRIVVPAVTAFLGGLAGGLGGAIPGGVVMVDIARREEVRAHTVLQNLKLRYDDGPLASEAGLPQPKTDSQI